jgi:hypothetical protein
LWERALLCSAPHGGPPTVASTASAQAGLTNSSSEEEEEEEEEEETLLGIDLESTPLVVLPASYPEPASKSFAPTDLPAQKASDRVAVSVTRRC